MKKLNNRFFKENPIEEMSIAKFAYVKAYTLLNEELNDKLDEIVLDTIDDGERMAKIAAEKEYLEHVDNAEELIKFMRKNTDIMNQRWICKKALEIEDEFMPLLLKYFERNRQDYFIETCSYILANADKKYTEKLYEIYHNIKSPYAQAMACLIFGICDMQDKLEFLVEEYFKMKNLYSDKDFFQLPLYAVYLLSDRI